MMIDSNAPLVPPAEVRETAGGVSGQGRFIGPLSMIIRAQLLARVSRIRLALPLAKPSTQNLSELAALVESRSISAIVDKSFAFDNAAAAIRYLEVEHARGKVVIDLS
jgi:NADPH:quinone reductase-like Zn-dependent oxidoreductase